MSDGSVSEGSVCIVVAVETVVIADTVEAVVFVLSAVVFEMSVFFVAVVVFFFFSYVVPFSATMPELSAVGFVIAFVNTPMARIAAVPAIKAAVLRTMLLRRLFSAISFSAFS